MRAGARIVAAAALSGALILTGTSCKIQVGKPSANQQGQTPANSVINTDHIQKDWEKAKFKPTGIVLHWWGYQNGSDIEAFATSLHSQKTKFDWTRTKAQATANPTGRLGVQFAVTKSGTAYQLTRTPDTFARHAKCANKWAIGIEIEGSGLKIINNKAQLAKVIALVKELQARYHIPTNGPIAANGLSGSGVHSHKQVDVVGCRWTDGQSMTQHKDDVDDGYLAYVKRHLN